MGRECSWTPTFQASNVAGAGRNFVRRVRNQDQNISTSLRQRIVMVSAGRSDDEQAASALYLCSLRSIWVHVTRGTAETPEL